MQPAKRRRGPSAMRILINDKPVDALTPKLVKSLMLAKVQAEVTKSPGGVQIDRLRINP